MCDCECHEKKVYEKKHILQDKRHRWRKVKRVIDPDQTWHDHYKCLAKSCKIKFYEIVSTKAQRDLMDDTERAIMFGNYETHKTHKTKGVQSFLVTN